jgi:formylglycine-generating enzyme required for sulfatase activity
VDNYPVVHISLIDAMEYCNWRSRQEGLKPVYTIGARVSIDNNAAGYRLPTEAEWEYACRAGTNTAYNTGGNSITTALANYYESRNFKPAPVKSYFANNWGLYDMHGNVSEWTQDNYERSEFVTTRGGSWGDDSTGLRSAYRLPMKTDLTLPSIGFRIVRSAR